ncbi:MAG: YhjD/YihY/BrkB family envelope integrity protein [Pseudomonadota bacterium]
MRWIPWTSIDDLPLPPLLRRWVVGPVWRALQRLSEPEIRIVSGGISFYALFSIFPLIYLTLTLLFALLPRDLSAQLVVVIDQLLVSAVEPLDEADVVTITQATPQGLTFRALLAVLLVLFTASSGAKAAITGIRMVAGTKKRSSVIRFQGTSILLTGALILLVWLLGAAQLALGLIAQVDNTAFELASDLARIANQLWLTKWIACFAVFYLLISLSLRGRIDSGRSMVAGAAVGAAAWIGATLAYQIYLQLSVLDTLYGALASLILGFLWLAASVMSLLLGSALTVEWSELAAPDTQLEGTEDA